MGPGGGSGQGLKGTVHIFSPALGRCARGHLRQAAILRAGTNRGSSLRAPTLEHSPVALPRSQTRSGHLSAGAISACYPVIISQARAAQVQSGSCIVLPSVPWWGRIGGIAAETLCGPQAPHSNALLAGPCDTSLNSAARAHPTWKVTQDNRPKAWVEDSPPPGPSEKEEVLRPSSFAISLPVEAGGGARCQPLLAPGGGHVRSTGRPWAPGPSWPGSPLMELICDLLISPEQIRL